MDAAYGYGKSEKINEILESNEVREADFMLVDMIESAKKEKEELLAKGAVQKAIETIKNMLRNKRPINHIAEDTGYTEDEILKIKEEILSE
jgi:hypothetical protein